MGQPMCVCSALDIQQSPETCVPALYPLHCKIMPQQHHHNHQPSLWARHCLLADKEQAELLCELVEHVFAMAPDAPCHLNDIKCFISKVKSWERVKVLPDVIQIVPNAALS